MSENNPTQLYFVRDPQGQVYGPADAGTLRQWVEQGRIVPGMSIARQETREWVEASSHPALAALFAARLIGASPTVEINTPASSLSPAQNQPQRAWNAGAEMTYAPPPRANMFGVMALICGCASILTSCIMCIPMVGCIGVPICGLLAVAAITFGSLAVWQIRGNPAAYAGKGMAVGGIALGGGVLLLGIIGIATVAIMGIVSSHR